MNEIVLFGLIIAAVAGVFVGKDADARGMNGIFWGLAVFGFMLVFLPLYALVRKPLPTPQPDKHIGA